MNIYYSNVKTISYIRLTLVRIMRLRTGRSSWASTSVSPGGCKICRCLLSSQVHCTDLQFWGLSMQAQWYSCAAQGFALVCSFFFLGMSNQIQADVDRNNQYLFSSSSTINQPHISLTVAGSTPQTVSVRSLSLRGSWYAVDLVLVPAPRRVQGATLQQPVDDVSARLLVLVSEQGVHEGVAGCLAVS